MEDFDEQWRKDAEKVEDITKRVAEHLDDDNEKAAQPSTMVRPFVRPTREEHERHQLTHVPYASWCKHCAIAKAVRANHPTKGRAQVIVPDVERGMEGPTKISMDYTYFHERGDNKRVEQANPPYLVVIEHKHGRIWTYQVHNKGVMGGAHWLPKRFDSNWDNNGMKNADIQLKSDQEPSIVNIQPAVQEVRERAVIFINSPVGESECNGRVENAIGWVQEKVRVLKHQIESNTKQKLHSDPPIMPWLVRWAAEFISKYAP